MTDRSQRLRGNHVLLVTPLLPDATLDEESTRSLLDFVIERNVDGVLALGSTGEVFALTDDERRRFAQVVCEHVAGRVPVGIGVAHSAADASAILAQHAASVGADYIFTTGPYYHPHGAEGIFRHVKQVGEATDLPLMVYDGGAGIEFSLALLARMTEEIPTLFASKLFLPYPQKIASYAVATAGRVQAWAGHDQLNYLMLLHGAAGMTSAASNVVPGEQTAIVDAIRAGDLETARDLFYSTVAPLNAIAFANVLQYPQCYKQALTWMGVIAHERCKDVMEPLDAVRVRELHSVLERSGLVSSWPE